MEYEDSMNLYEYVHNSPTNYTDPMGLETSKDDCFSHLTTCFEACNIINDGGDCRDPEGRKTGPSDCYADCLKDYEKCRDKIPGVEDPGINSDLVPNIPITPIPIQPIPIPTPLNPGLTTPIPIGLSLSIYLGVENE
jgi:hypothetical protein